MLVIFVFFGAYFYFSCSSLIVSTDETSSESRRLPPQRPDWRVCTVYICMWLHYLFVLCP